MNMKWEKLLLNGDMQICRYNNIEYRIGKWDNYQWALRISGHYIRCYKSERLAKNAARRYEKRRKK